MLQSQISCHTFLCLSQLKPLWNWLMETRDIPKELELLYIASLTIKLYTQWDQFNIVQVTLPTPSHKVPSNFMLDFKILRLNLFNVVNFLTLKVVLGDHPTRLKKNRLYSNINCQIQPLQRQEYFCPNCLCTFKTKYLSDYLS